jgi:osmoprotectant transport system substrate-binding protein
MRRKVRANLLQLLGLVIVLALVAAGCGGGGGGASGKVDLSNANITVGSKEFTEQLVLGQIAIQLLENAGATVKDQTRLAGSVAAREALTSGQIDTYWEYTGTGWITYLKHTKPVPNPHKQYEAVAKEDLQKNNIVWLPPAPANNTYAFAVRKEAYDKLGVKKISDFGPLIKNNPSEATLCIGSEFATRDDGLPGVEKSYGFKFPGNDLVKLDEGLIYQAVDKGDKCNFGEVFQTDGRISALGLKLIADDKNFFPIYQPSLNVREDVIKKYPQIKKLFAPVSQKLTTQTLQKLNAEVDVKGLLPEDVAQKWLSENGFI